MKFTVLIVTYHPKLPKLLVTLESVLQQTFRDYEIVIADDGSKENYFPFLRKYFARKGFENYKLVENRENQGTVRNLLSGLAAAEGKYVRDFGPGDAFYDKDTLCRLYAFMEENKVECCFGLMCGYYMDRNGNLQYKNFPHPFDIEAYRGDGRAERILKNLIVYSDHVSGACTCYTKELYQHYLERIKDVVRYEEDIFQVLAALEGRQMKLFDEYLVWYETDSGVSTEKHSNFEELLRRDVASFYEMMFEKYKGNLYVEKRRRLTRLYGIKNLYVRTMLRFFKNPDALRYLGSAWIQRRKKAHVSTGQAEGMLQTGDFWKRVQEEVKLCR